MSVVEKAAVSVWITHPDAAGEVGVVLVHPSAPDVESGMNVKGSFGAGADCGAGADDADRMTFDDDADTVWTESDPPFVGTWRPNPVVDELAQAIGEDPDGMWRLRVYDNVTGNTGVLRAASLFLTVEGEEIRYDVADLPQNIPDSEVVPGLVVDFAQAAYRQDDPWPYDSDKAGFMVKILTELPRGVPDESERFTAGISPSLRREAIVVQQFADVEVNHRLDEGRTANVTISMHDQDLGEPGHIAALQPFQQATWIGYRRPGEERVEGIFCGQANVTEDYSTEVHGVVGTIGLPAWDPVEHCRHAQVRRGDPALNVDKNRGRLPASAESIDTIIESARNTLEQQNREIPVLGLKVALLGSFPGEFANIDYERGQEVMDLCEQIIRAANGPNADFSAPWVWPLRWYAYLNLYDPPTDPEDPGASELGRNLDPADPDDPQPGEVIFEIGRGLDNVEALGVEPGMPATHAHVLDNQHVYRVTRADAASSYLVGAWTEWLEADIVIQRPRKNPDRVTALDPANIPADLAPLVELAKAHVRAYGVPPKFFTLRLRPDDAQTTHYGHPDWAAFMAARGGADAGGDWYIGDYVRVRGVRGYRSFSTLARIVSVTPRQDGWNGNLYFEVGFIPAIGGSPELDTDYPLDASQEPSVPGDPPDAPPDPPEPGEEDEPPPAGTLLFEDHFDGETLDAEAWATYYGPGHANNGWRRPSQIAVVNDQLVITAHWDGANIVSGGMAHRENYLYGTFIARVKTERDPSGQTSAECITWPESENWPHDGELDWYETGTETDRTPFSSFLHWQDATLPNEQTHIAHAADASEWHVMRMDWTATEVRIYRDGVLIGSETDDAKIPNTPMHVTLQLDALSNNPMGQDVRFYVDYVQVYAL